MKPKASDFILAAAVIILAAAIWIFPMRSGEKAARVYIECNGKMLENVDVSKDMTIPLGGMTVEISDGCVFVSETDCPDRVCEKTGKISKAGEAIICIPNKVIIEIMGERELDIIAN